MLTSLDGYFEGPEHDLSWHKVDKEFNDFAIEQTKGMGLMLYGRRTYQLMESFWPKAVNEPDISKEDLIVADLMNNTPKIVFSKTLEKVEEQENWKNVQLRRQVDVEEIKRLKQEEGGDIAVYGSSNLCVTLIEKRLIDEFRILVNPVVIGKGTPLFQGLKQKLDLKLMNSQTFQNGNVLLVYHP